MLKTKIFFSIPASLMAILFISPIMAFAQTTAPAVNVRLSDLHTLADTAINNRLTDLQNTLIRVNGLIKLSTDEKTSYGNEITADINGLNTLKTKVDGDTDLPTLRNDYRSIFTQYRVYAEFLPQIRLLTASDTMDVTADKLATFAGNLQTRITVVGNPSNLASLLSDMQGRISDAKTQYNSVQSTITSLTPQSYDSNPTGTTAVFKTARTEIQTGASDLKAALSDGKQILQALKSFPTPTP